MIINNNLTLYANDKILFTTSTSHIKKNNKQPQTNNAIKALDTVFIVYKETKQSTTIVTNVNYSNKAELSILIS